LVVILDNILVNMKNIIKRGKWFHFMRRIPKMYMRFYNPQQKYIKVTLKTDSEIVAMQRAQILNAELEKIWSHMAFNGDLEKDNMLEDAVFHSQNSLASSHTTREVADKGIGSIVSRVYSVSDEQDQKKNNLAIALGSNESERYSFQQAFTDFVDFERPNLMDKSDHQFSKWRNPRAKAVSNFLEIIGDKDVREITRDDTLDFRKTWHGRLISEGLTANTANKQFSFIKQILSYVCDDKRMEIDLSGLFDRLRFAEEKRRGVPFNTQFITDTLLDLDNLSGLNKECTLFLYAMADTGARNSELVGLRKKDIRLDADIPFIDIRPHKGRTLKTAQSERKIPLVGASLYAFKQLPDGFDQYYCKADLLSSTTNKFLKENDLLPSPKHSVYSLRHSFDDRLVNAEVPEKTIAALMGHKYKGRTIYGKGADLELKHTYMNKIALDI